MPCDTMIVMLRSSAGSRRTVGADPVLRVRRRTIKEPDEHPDYHVDIEPHGMLGGRTGTLRLLRLLRLRRRSTVLDSALQELLRSEDQQQRRHQLRRGLRLYPFGNSNYTYSLSVFAGRPSVELLRRQEVERRAGVRVCAGHWRLLRLRSLRRRPGLPQLGHLTPDVLAFVGRYHFSDNVALTMRIGYPASSSTSASPSGSDETCS